MLEAVVQCLELQAGVNGPGLADLLALAVKANFPIFDHCRLLLLCNKYNQCYYSASRHVLVWQKNGVKKHQKERREEGGGKSRGLCLKTNEKIQPDDLMLTFDVAFKRRGSHSPSCAVIFRILLVMTRQLNANYNIHGARAA